MTQSRTPHRVSFGGGGTDLPPFYERYGGEVISVTIDKYVSVTVSDEHTGIAHEHGTLERIDACLKKTGSDAIEVNLISHFQ